MLLCDLFPFLNSKNNKTALAFDDGFITYSELDNKINSSAVSLLKGKKDLKEERIAILLSASLNYVVSLISIWRAGGIAVPCNTNASVLEIEYALRSVKASRLIVDFHQLSKEVADEVKELCQSLGIIVISSDQLTMAKKANVAELSPQRRAMILFTSGTTNKPKGVVSTYKNLKAQINTLLVAWEWQQNDSIALFLPLHHIHGIINILCCGLASGGTVHLYPKFSLKELMDKVSLNTFSLFMAVPTIYVKIIQYLETLELAESKKITDAFKKMRVNISGSAACPDKVYHQWLAMTGQVILERYGMTELGMAISNPYNTERRAGSVGIPLPGVDVALFDESNIKIEEEHVPGEIRVKGQNVFLEYWDNQSATKESFFEGWFCTGDIAVIENGYYRIMGRSSIDIIKSGGYKLSALEIEGVLLNHNSVDECAVIGMADDMWGEIVVAFIVIKPKASFSLAEFTAWCGKQMSAYKVPKRINLLETLPRNAMGKVTKPKLKKLLAQEG